MKALYPGSFDPFHNGHYSIVEKSSKLFDEVLLTITINPEKDSNISFEERMKNVKEQVKDFTNVTVLINDSMMTGDFAKKMGVKYLIRSARDNTDFNYELELAAGNKEINSELETIIIIPDTLNVQYRSRLEKQKI